MSTILNICKNNCEELYPYYLKFCCGFEKSKITIIQNGNDIENIELNLNKVVEDYESGRKILKANVATKLDLKDNTKFIMIKPNFTNAINLDYQNIEFIKSDSIKKVNQLLSITPDEKLVLLTNNIISNSYNPKLIIPSIFDLENINITITDSQLNKIEYNFNNETYLLTFINSLLGNNIYDIKILYEALDDNNNIFDTLETSYKLFVNKKKLKTFKHVSILNKIDIDNDIHVLIENINSNIDLNSINIDIPNVYGFFIKDKQITEKNGVNILEFNIDFIGNLKENTDYTINVSYEIDSSEIELASKEIIFTTNLFHSCVYKESFSDIFLKIINKKEISDYIYLINNTNIDIIFNYLIGYSEINIPKINIC